MRKLICCYALVISLVLCAHADAAFKLKVEVDDTTLLPGETTLVRVYGLVEEAGVDNGLALWEMDVDLDLDGVIKVTDTAGEANITMVAPSPYYVNALFPNWDAFNAGVSGTIDYANILIDENETTSSTGVGGYSELFNFEIEALNVVTQTTVGYSLSGVVGELMDGQAFGMGASGVAMDVSDGVLNKVTVLPEPSSLLILSGLGIIGYLRRKK
jgi:hypothetical protein